LHFGLGLLRLAPDIFWSMTVWELMALGGALRPADGPDRAAMAALMRRWPDPPAMAEQEKSQHGTR
jgi:uncharacterized phage protein (TIGR02216 family)